MVETLDRINDTFKQFSSKSYLMDNDFSVNLTKKQLALVIEYTPDPNKKYYINQNVMQLCNCALSDSNMNAAYIRVYGIDSHGKKYLDDFMYLTK